MENKEEKPKDKGGRPKKVLDMALIDKYLRAGCPGTEVATLLGVSKDTVYKRVKEVHGVSFDEYAQKQKAAGKEFLRFKQYEEAVNGNQALLIFLGKNILGQSDKQQTESTFNLAGVLEGLNEQTLKNILLSLENLENEELEEQFKKLAGPKYKNDIGPEEF